MRDKMLKHDQLYIKQQNKQWVYELIKTKEPLTKPDLVKHTKMSPTSINRIVNDLISENLIYEKDNDTKSVGRNAVFLQINRDARCSIGLEFDMSVIRIGVINLKGELTYMKEVPFSVRANPDSAIDKSVSMMNELILEQGIDREKILGVGVGLPGYIDDKKGKVIHSDQLIWKDMNIAQLILDKTDFQTVVDNELKMQAVSEKHTWKENEEETMVLVGIGSGIGAAVLINGEIYRGSSNTAGEIGHSIVNPNGNVCKCGKVGCLASYISERSLIQQAATAMQAESMADLAHYYEQGQPLVKLILEQAVMYLAIAIGNIYTTYDPKLVVLSGQFFKYFPRLKTELEIRLNQYSQHDDAKRIKYSTLQNKGVVLGAGIVAGERFLELG
ncbi:ROK family protein [Alkalihalobacillus sp. 1P02AB]|uniref:ROK family transcriptional regulator n=1 Tax=Alkalihalobacillus sp. 1P02AB TaxID=3132260 RepID=UPI0039A66FE7